MFKIRNLWAKNSILEWLWCWIGTIELCSLFARLWLKRSSFFDYSQTVPVCKNLGIFLLPFFTCWDSDIVVEGNWSSWEHWSLCNVTCGGGTQKRTRQCIDPAPTGGGKACEGSSSEVQTCNRQACSGNFRICTLNINDQWVIDHWEHKVNLTFECYITQQNVLNTRVIDNTKVKN